MLNMYIMIILHHMYNKCVQIKNKKILNNLNKFIFGLWLNTTFYFLYKLLFEKNLNIFKIQKLINKTKTNFLFLFI